MLTVGVSPPPARKGETTPRQKPKGKVVTFHPSPFHSAAAGRRTGSIEGIPYYFAWERIKEQPRSSQAKSVPKGKKGRRKTTKATAPQTPPPPPGGDGEGQAAAVVPSLELNETEDGWLLVPSATNHATPADSIPPTTTIDRDTSTPHITDQHTLTNAGATGASGTLPQQDEEKATVLKPPGFQTEYQRAFTWPELILPPSYNRALVHDQSNLANRRQQEGRCPPTKMTSTEEEDHLWYLLNQVPPTSKKGTNAATETGGGGGGKGVTASALLPLPPSPPPSFIDHLWDVMVQDPRERAARQRTLDVDVSAARSRKGGCQTEEERKEDKAVITPPRIKRMCNKPPQSSAYSPSAPAAASTSPPSASAFKKAAGLGHGSSSRGESSAIPLRSESQVSARPTFS